MNLARVNRLLQDAASFDRAAPADEATLMALQAGKLLVRSIDENAVALLRDDDLTLVVHPEHRGRGLGGQLLRDLLQQGPQISTAWSHIDHPAAARLAATTGFDRVRELWVMRRAAADLPPRTAPPSVRIRGFGEHDIPSLLRINAAAFATHPEQGAMDSANFQARMRENQTVSADLLVAEDDEGLLGFHWTKRHSPTLGEVYVVGIAPQAQGRGLGKTLTLAGLHHLAESGVAEILLYVEADNLPAIATYRRLGFTHAADDTHVQYQRRTTH